MRTLKRLEVGEISFTVIAKNEIRVQLNNGDAFDINENSTGELNIKKVDGYINISPRAIDYIMIK